MAWEKLFCTEVMKARLDILLRLSKIYGQFEQSILYFIEKGETV